MKRSRRSAVVVDTNILIRAFLSGKRGEDRILQEILRGSFELIYSRSQLAEFIGVLGYTRITKKYVIDQSLLRLFMEWVHHHGKEMEPELVHLCRDPEDNHILGLAMGAARNRTVYVVTGDEDILVLRGSLEQVEILTPGQFLRKVK